MEFARSENNTRKVIVTVDNREEAVDVLTALPMWRWLRPRTLRLDFETVGLIKPEYPRPITFTRQELAQAASHSLLVGDHELAEQITDFFKTETETPVAV